MFGGHLLSVLVWLPIVGGFAVLGVGNDNARAARWVSLAVAVATFAASIPLYTNFNSATAAMQFTERAAWIPSLHADFHLGVDGISMPLILLTTFMTVLVVIVGWGNVEKRIAQYFGAFLILEGTMIGVFVALDALLFYVFWEIQLIPMFLIIGVWGGSRRVYATIKFFLYTFLGSVLMLVALIYLYLKTGTYDLAAFQRVPLSLTEQTLIFLALFAAFAVKVPMWPVHTWLPDAHVEAPTGGSVILAAILLKMGGYGFLRLSLPITPDASRELTWLMISLVVDCDHLYLLRRIGAARHEETDRLFVDRAHGIRHARRFRRLPDPRAHRRNGRHRDGAGWRDGADDLARSDLRRPVPMHRRALRSHAHPRNQRLRRCRQYDADLRDVDGPIRFGERGFAGDLGVRRRVPGDSVVVQGQRVVRISGRDDAGARRRLYPVARQTRDIRGRRQRPRRGFEGPRTAGNSSCWARLPQPSCWLGSGRRLCST